VDSSPACGEESVTVVGSGSSAVDFAPVSGSSLWVADVTAPLELDCRIDGVDAGPGSVGSALDAETSAEVLAVDD
jgi:hypothetical protein